jgi:hypothetical protein
LTHLAMVANLKNGIAPEKGFYYGSRYF